MEEDEIELVYSNEPKEPCWPFWGNLKSLGTSAYDKQGWNHTLISDKVLGADIFDRFYIVGSNALSMLKNRSISELRTAAKEIQVVIDEWIDEYIETETESKVQSLFKNGGWELGYLQPDSTGSEANIRDLLDNWSSEWERITLPQRGDYTALFALTEYVQYNEIDPKEFVYLGFCEPSKHEIFALLGVMIICAAVNTHRKSIAIKNSLSEVIALSISTIEAVEAIAYAEKLRSEERMINLIGQKVTEVLKPALASFESEKEKVLKAALASVASGKAKNSADIRFAPNNKAKVWVKSEWEENKDAYKGNKSEFARIYSKRVLNEYQDIKGDPLNITEKTIREIWLRDTPNASK